MTRLPARFDAVVFDMDGTLLDTEGLYREVLFGVCAELGHPMTDAIHRDMIGHPRERNRAMLMRVFGADFPIALYAERARAGMAERCRAGVPLKQGARELLAGLRALGIPCAIATSTAREEALHHLELAGLLEFFAAIVTRSDVTHAKPHPETFLRAAGQLGAEPRHCLAVEDSHNGVRAAHAAGMHTIMVPDMLPPTEEIRALCAMTITGLDALHALIRERAP